MKKFLLGVGAAVAVAVVGFLGGTFSSNPPANIGAFTTSGSNFTDVKVTGDLDVDSNMDLTGATTTISNIKYDSKFYTALTLTGTVTTTPGLTGSLTNTGAPKLCNLVQLDISQLGTDAFVFSVSTTTAAGVGNGANLIASTTVATSTASIQSTILDNVENPGSYNANSFVWGNGQVITVGFDALGTPDNASSTARDVMTGGLYVTCHTR